MNLRIHKRAGADMNAGIDFYGQQGQGVGDYFLVESILSDIESLRLYAGIHRKSFGYHRKISKVFPFSIYYLVTGDTVSVWRVLDSRRDPALD
jgi:plasmid stabilization system protein ParE